MKLKKSLGQHFLKDKNILNKIISYLPESDGSLVVEIGPGAGTLTELLLDRFPMVVAVEIDQQWVEFLKQKFPGKPNFRLIRGDILETDISQIARGYPSVWLVGNIPYNITSPIVFKMIENYKMISTGLLLMQKEVAQRIVAREGSKEYGILSIATQVFYDSSIVYHIPPEAFTPPPKVHSSLIHFSAKKTPLIQEDEWKAFNKFVHTIFSSRRKMIRNNLKKIVNLNDPSLSQISGSFLNKRAEQLSIQEIYMMFKMLKEVLPA